MGDKERQDLGKADASPTTGTQAGRKCGNGRQDETRVREGERSTQGRYTCGETMGDKASGRRAHHPTQEHCQETMENKGRQDLRKAGRPTTAGTYVRRKWETETRQGRTLGRRTHHPTTKGNQKGDGRHWGASGAKALKAKQEGRQGETRPWEGVCRRVRLPTLAHMWGDNGRQAGARRDKGGTQHPTQAQMWGDNGRQWKTMEDNGRQWVTSEEKTSRRQTHHPTLAHMWGDNGRQAETRPRDGGHPFQQRNKKKGRQDFGKDTPLFIIQLRHTCENNGRQWGSGGKTSGRWGSHPKGAKKETMGDFGKADPPSSSAHVGRQGG